jgi:alkylation response protein AidB-like acyl-CoA dehydrogenase
LKINVDTTLLEAGRQIAPVIRAHNDEAERERRFSKPVLAALTEAGLMGMLTPRSLGGLEVDPLTCARVVEEVAAADSAAGWSLSTPCPGRLSAPDCQMRARKSSLGGIRMLSWQDRCTRPFRPPRSMAAIA